MTLFAKIRRGQPPCWSCTRQLGKLRCLALQMKAVFFLIFVRFVCDFVLFLYRFYSESAVIKGLVWLCSRLLLTCISLLLFIFRRFYFIFYVWTVFVLIISLSFAFCFVSRLWKWRKFIKSGEMKKIIQTIIMKWINDQQMNLQ